MAFAVYTDLRKFDSQIGEARTLFGVLSHTAGPVYSDAKSLPELGLCTCRAQFESEPTQQC